MKKSNFQSDELFRKNKMLNRFVDENLDQIERLKSTADLLKDIADVDPFEAQGIDEFALEQVAGKVYTSQHKRFLANFVFDSMENDMNQMLTDFEKFGISETTGGAYVSILKNTTGQLSSLWLLAGAATLGAVNETYEYYLELFGGNQEAAKIEAVMRVDWANIENPTIYPRFDHENGGVAGFYSNPYDMMIGEGFYKQPEIVNPSAELPLIKDWKQKQVNLKQFLADSHIVDFDGYLVTRPKTPLSREETVRGSLDAGVNSVLSRLNWMDNVPSEFEMVYNNEELYVLNASLGDYTDILSSSLGKYTDKLSSYMNGISQLMGIRYSMYKDTQAINASNSTDTLLAPENKTYMTENVGRATNIEQNNDFVFNVNGDKEDFTEKAVETFVNALAASALMGVGGSYYV